MIFAIFQEVVQKHEKKVKILTLVGFPLVSFHWISKNFGFGLLLHISTTYLRKNKIRNVVWPPRVHYPHELILQKKLIN